MTARAAKINVTDIRENMVEEADVAEKRGKLACIYIETVSTDQRFETHLHRS